jgi:hypothetical protein
LPAAAIGCSSAEIIDATDDAVQLVHQRRLGDVPVRLQLIVGVDIRVCGAGGQDERGIDFTLAVGAYTLTDCATAGYRM